MEDPSPQAHLSTDKHQQFTAGIAQLRGHLTVMGYLERLL